MRYGLPYKGSKSKIAPFVVDHLPSADWLVDIFAGGCAVTHAALLSGRLSHVMANDMTDAPQIFVDAANGEYAGYSVVPTREEFMRGDDDAERLLYSFGNNRRDYLWSKKLGPVKAAASRMLSAPSVHERRMEYKKFCHELARYLIGDDEARKLTGSDDASDTRHGLQGLEGLERLEGLQGLEGLERLEGLQVTKLDYRDVPVPYGATVYADPPYRGTSDEAYGGGFDSSAFDEWLSNVPFMVIVSEYECPAGCIEIAATKRLPTCGTGNRGGHSTERLFVQERFADEYAKRMGRIQEVDAC